MNLALSINTKAIYLLYCTCLFLGKFLRVYCFLTYSWIITYPITEGQASHGGCPKLTHVRAKCAFGYHPIQKQHLLFFTMPPLKSENCPDPHFLGNPPYISPYILFFLWTFSLKTRFFGEPPYYFFLIPYPIF